MTALYIIGAVLLLLVLLLLLRIRVYFSYYGGVPRIDIRAGVIKFGRDLKGVQSDEDEAALEKALAKQKDKQKQKSKKQKKQPQKKGKPKLTDALRVLRAGVYAFLRKYKKYARLEKYVLKISLATDDPAKTAVLYGALSGVVGSLHAFATSIKNRSRRVGDIFTEYRPDFYAEKPDIAVEIGFSLRVWHILSCALTLWRTYRKYKKLPPKPAKKAKNKKGDTENESSTA